MVLKSWRNHEYVARNNERELEGYNISNSSIPSNARSYNRTMQKRRWKKFVKNVKREISIDYIQKTVSDYFQLDLEMLHQN
jgi:chromosomal replication initiator protein